MSGLSSDVHAGADAAPEPEPDSSDLSRQESNWMTKRRAKLHAKKEQEPAEEEEDWDWMAARKAKMAAIV